MTFSGWCALRADITRRHLRVTWVALMRRRIIREQQLHAALAYEEVADSLPPPPAPREIPAAKECRNHPGKWAQHNGLCRECMRVAGDRRSVREIQAARPRRLRRARLPVYGK